MMHEDREIFGSIVHLTEFCVDKLLPMWYAERSSSYIARILDTVWALSGVLHMEVCGPESACCSIAEGIEERLLADD